MVFVNYRLKKYAKKIPVYIKIQIVETSKYDLSCIRYCIVMAICRFIIIF
jgi:hypothetical protein